MAVDGALWAVLEVADRLKPEASVVIAGLKRLGVSPWMLTGDNRATARAVARLAGIHPDNVLAEVKPGQKAKVVKGLQQQGHVVCMIGDGVNDAPALTQANVSMAIGSGTDIAVEAADLVLMRADLRDVLVAIDLSRRTFQRIKLNMFFSLVYNCMAVPVAAGVFYPFTHIIMPPTVASIAMAMSSVSVVSSSLMLKRYKKPSLSVPLHVGRSLTAPLVSPSIKTFSVEMDL